MHISHKIRSFAIVISNIADVFQPLAITIKPESATNLEEAIEKLPPKTKEPFFHQTYSCNLHAPSAVDINDWLEFKAEVHACIRPSRDPRNITLRKQKPPSLFLQIRNHNRDKTSV